MGLALLYDLINKRDDLLAERVYCPWTDFEAIMRRDGIPLYGLESRHPVADFDIFAFSLPYEQLYTNVLTMLDLAGIPLRAADRGVAHPLVIAGGSGCYNPEPMSAFFDAMVIGEGEEVIFEVIEAFSEWRMANGEGNAQWTMDNAQWDEKIPDPQSPNSPFAIRHSLWTRLAAIPGVYVPALVRRELCGGWVDCGDRAQPSQRAGGGDEAGGDRAAGAGDQASSCPTSMWSTTGRPSRSCGAAPGAVASARPG